MNSTKALFLFAATSFAGAAFSVTAVEAAEETAILAGGCFWCIEKDFEQVDGVVDVVSGYTGGSNENPTYQNHTQFGHREVVRITYDGEKISYGELLDIYWRTVDPTDAGGQFCDRGHSYTTAIYALDDEQAKTAQRSKQDTQKALGQEIVTPIEAAKPFTAAEGYHQNYYEKSKVRYNYYRFACGRNQRVEQLWGDEAYRGVDKAS